MGEEATPVEETSAEAKKPHPKKPPGKAIEPPTDFASAVKLSDAGSATVALPFLKQLSESEPDNSDVWRELGIAQFRTDAFAESLASLEKATHMNPHDARAWFFLGAAYRMNKRPWDAVKAYKEVLEIEPDHPQARDDLRGAEIAVSILKALGRLPAD